MRMLLSDGVALAVERSETNLELEMAPIEVGSGESIFGCDDIMVENRNGYIHVSRVDPIVFDALKKYSKSGVFRKRKIKLDLYPEESVAP